MVKSGIGVDEVVSLRGFDDAAAVGVVVVVVLLEVDPLHRGTTRRKKVRDWE